MKQTIVPPNKSVRQTHLSRLYFQTKGCKQASLESTGGKVLWANGKEGYFMSAYGVKQIPTFSPAMQKKGSKANNGKRGLSHPKMRNFNTQYAHRLMFETFADEPCPIFFTKSGKPYKGIVHHVIENPYDIRMVNLMGWLTYKQHHIADKRRSALESVLPNMYCADTAYLKELEDPRITTDETFQSVLANLRNRYQIVDPADLMEHDITHHREN